jgi:hypothetical protein
MKKEYNYQENLMSQDLLDTGKSASSKLTKRDDSVTITPNSKHNSDTARISSHKKMPVKPAPLRKLPEK